MFHPSVELTLCVVCAITSIEVIIKKAIRMVSNLVTILFCRNCFIYILILVLLLLFDRQAIPPAIDTLSRSGSTLHRGRNKVSILGVKLLLIL